MSDIEDKLLRIVLVGKTGSGKSATANTLLGRNVFESKIVPHALTQSCQVASREWEGRSLIVVDTPGLFDTQKSLDTTCREISRCVVYSAPGPHAIVMVVRLGRYTEEEQTTIKLLKRVFGDSAMKHMIFLFTRKEELRGQSLSEFIAESTEALRNNVKEAGSRCCAFNNKAGEAEKEAQVQELVGLIERMVRSNRGAYFSDPIYKYVEARCKEMEEKMKKISTEQLQKEIKRVEEENADKPKEERERKIEELKTNHEEQMKKAEEEAKSGLLDSLVNTVKKSALKIWNLFWN